MRTNNKAPKLPDDALVCLVLNYSELKTLEGHLLGGPEMGLRVKILSELSKFKSYQPVGDSTFNRQFCPPGYSFLTHPKTRFKGRELVEVKYPHGEIEPWWVNVNDPFVKQHGVLAWVIDKLWKHFDRTQKKVAAKKRKT